MDINILIDHHAIHDTESSAVVDLDSSTPVTGCEYMILDHDCPDSGIMRHVFILHFCEPGQQSEIIKAGGGSC